MRVRGGRGVRAGAGPGDACSWLPGVTCGSSVCHGSSLLRDLVDDGLHELWRKACDLDWSSTRLSSTHRDLLSLDLRAAARFIQVHLHHYHRLHGLVGDSDHMRRPLALNWLLIGCVGLWKRGLAL